MRLPHLRASLPTYHSEPATNTTTDHGALIDGVLIVLGFIRSSLRRALIQQDFEPVQAVDEGSDIAGRRGLGTEAPEDVSAGEFLEYVARGPCEVREKIRNDTFRTLATDRGFKERVREDMLVRLLDAFVWRNHDRQESHHLGFTYVQGMNVLAAPFLYTMPSELEAFFCFAKFIEESCPLYVQPTLEGVHRGLKLLDRCLKIVDPDLFAHLRSKNLSAEIYAFPSILTLCACTPPLDQVLQLWDFLLAFGVHLNVLCVIAQLLLMREEVMTSSRYDLRFNPRLTRSC
ncbi:hypothetical protein EVJ58_g10170 [Rhodofomes roseus]|uniref:Rab-GAP TBC domain-containing protein n=1 Tax=Rhodofomes roseus TaxID=34475 RepID=A0A4Y9XRY8_9APHY|nr:hypothetical protein EVJ58_g10170 [Rhodofomes roseus]